MANQITDNRTQLDPSDVATNYDDLAGAAQGTADAENTIEGSASVGYSQSNARDGLLFDNASTIDLSNQTIWMWVNCAAVSLLDTKANAGMTMRFCGNTVTDFFEVYIGGSNDWPITFEGGWAMFVVDIEEASNNPSNTGGTAPATSAIRYVGISAIFTSMPKMQDNTFIDSIWYAPTSGPAWIVEGQDQTVSAHDWNMDDVEAQLTISAGLVLPLDGGGKLVTGPGQFGINDTTTHGFTSTNDILLWSNQEFILDGFYGFSALGNSGGTTNVTFGAKTGTGDAATGAQGATISAEGTGTRWFMDFDDPDLDLAAFYGCSFIHGGDFVLDDAAVSIISSLYIDCDTALVSNSEQLRVSVINANTADGVAFMTTDDLSDIVFSSFEFSDGHGVELTTPRVATQASKGNVFTSYGITTSNDAAVYNNSGGAVTINVTDGGSDITYRDGASASTTIVLNPVTLTLNVLEQDGTPIQNARALVRAGSTGPLPYLDSVTITNSVNTATVAHTAHGLVTSDKVVIEGATNDEEYNGIKTITVTGANEYTYATTGGPASPATGTITSTAVIIDELTTAGGVANDTRTYSSDQDIDSVRSHVRKGSSGDDPKFKTSPVTGTIDSANGLTINVLMIEDQ